MDTSGIADANGLSNVQYKYQWLADDSDISGATNATYTLATADEGKAIKVQVSFTDDEGNEETLTSTATDAVSAAPAANSPATGVPTISGTAQVGETLMANTTGVADADGLSNVQYEYQWLADHADIAGATGLTYTLTDSEESKAITVRVSFTDDDGNSETLTSTATGAVDARPNSPATGAPTITGTAQVGQTLTADTSGIADANGLSNVQYEYQWLADAAEISGATNATYTLVAADEAKAITVQVSFTAAADNPESADAQWYVFIATPDGEILGHYNAEDFAVHLQEMLDDGSFRATEEGVWVNHEDVNPVTGEVEDKHFWLVEHDGLVFGSGWHHDVSGSRGDIAQSGPESTPSGEL